jgi:hypothetical protein
MKKNKILGQQFRKLVNGKVEQTKIIKAQHIYDEEDLEKLSTTMDFMINQMNTSKTILRECVLQNLDNEYNYLHNSHLLCSHITLQLHKIKEAIDDLHFADHKPQIIFFPEDETL